MKTATDKAVMVPMEVEYRPAWLTWVASATGCLRALGIDCDLVDVAGMSTYAFVMCVHEELCPSGPTVFNWGDLPIGINLLGRSTLCYQSTDCHTEETANDRTRAHCRYAYELVEKEVAEGRPCVIWGTYVPEFGIAIGVEDGKYHVKSFKEVLKQEQPPIPYDGINAPGGPYVLAFPTPTVYADKVSIDRFALGRAYRQLTSKSEHSKYSYGLEAYDWWIEALEANRADAFGNAYNAQCWSEAKEFAKEFLKRIASRNEKPREALNKVVSCYEEVCGAMSEIASMFPFPPGEQLKDEKTRSQAIKALKTAEKAEEKAVKHLRKALEADWGDVSC
jgi:hypothetical protein